MDIKARKSQLKQLTKYIIKRYKSHINNPILIMGDMNCFPKYEWDKNLIDKYLLHAFDNYDLDIQEALSNYPDLDRIFFINNGNLKYTLSYIDCYFDRSVGKLSDHYPLVAKLLIKENNKN